jgi:hypothetical protein
LHSESIDGQSTTDRWLGRARTLGYLDQSFEKEADWGEILSRRQLDYLPYAGGIRTLHYVLRNSLVKFTKGSTALSDSNVKVITAG